MPQEAIPFVPDEASGLSELARASPVAHNVVIEQSGAVRRRPGIKNHTLEGVIDARGFDGLHSTYGGDLYAMSREDKGRKFYLVKDTHADDLTSKALSHISGPERPVFAETEGMLVAATGKHPDKVEFPATEVELLGGDTPECTHIVAHASRLVANDIALNGVLRYSGFASGGAIAGHEEWDFEGTSAGAVTAEGRPDPVVAVGENTAEVFAFGTGSEQVYVADAQLGLASVATRELGAASGYCVIKRDQQFFWLDQLRRIVRSDGREFEVISGPIQQTLNNLQSTVGAFGYWVHVGAADCLVWTFPSDGITLAYQVGGGWARWQSWDEERNNWAQFDVLSHAIKWENGVNIVGTQQGRIGEFSMTTHTDLEKRIRAYVVTGFLDRGTQARKQCLSVRLSLKRGNPGEAQAQAGWLKWKERPGDWTGKVPIDFGRYDQDDVVLEFRSLGVYRTRQWAFEFSDSNELVLASAVEEFDVLSQ